MHKVICLVVAGFYFVFGFLLCAFFFVCSGENTDRWGDLATWTGSGVTFLALIAAIAAAWWSKRASDQQTEKNTLTSLYSTIHSNVCKINDSFMILIRDLHDESKQHEKQKLIEYFANGLNVSFFYIQKIIYASLIIDENKDALEKWFLSSLSYQLIDEIITGTPTALFRNGRDHDFLFWKTSRQLYRYINAEIRRLGMYETLTESADRNHL